MALNRTQAIFQKDIIGSEGNCKGFTLNNPLLLSSYGLTLHVGYGKTTGESNLMTSHEDGLKEPVLPGNLPRI